MKTGWTIVEKIFAASAAAIPVLALVLSKDPFANLLPNQLQNPAKVAGVVLAVLVTWLIIQHYQWFQIPIGKQTLSGGLEIPKKFISKAQFTLYLIFSLAFLIMLFIFINLLIHDGPEKYAFQFSLYLTIFTLTVAILALLGTTLGATRQAQFDRYEFPTILRQTMDERGLVGGQVEILYDNFVNDMQFISRTSSVRQLRVRIPQRNASVIDLITSIDGREIYQVTQPVTPPQPQPQAQSATRES